MTDPQDPKRRQLFGAGMQQLSSNWDVCLWPAGDCSGKAIRAHSIQNRVVLDRICCDDHVVMPKLQVSLKKPPHVEFKLVGRRRATTFTGLCSKHDSELFGEIETQEIDLENSYHRFLLSYRAILKETHSSRKAAIDTQINYEKGVEEGIYPDGPCPAGISAVELMMAASQLDEPKQVHDQAYMSKDYSKISHICLYLDVSPSIAVNSVLSTNLWDESTDSLAFLGINIFPCDSDTTVMLCSYLSDHDAQANMFLGPILASSGIEQLRLISRLVLKKCENMAIAPSLYSTYSLGQKRAVNLFYTRNSNGLEYESTDPKIYLFKGL
jgi:hypothetical protein